MKSFSELSLRFFHVAVLIFGLTGFAFAQTSTAELNGVVKDPTGAVISGATLRLIDVATNAELTTTATDQGTFVF